MIKHDYRLHGDDMREVYPPDYQAHLDAPELNNLDDEQKSELDKWLDLLNSDIEGAPF